jgi:DNA-binding IclR family transcriptional regulator
VIDCLKRSTEPIPLASLEQETGLPDKTVRRVVEDRVALELVERTKDAGKWYVQESAIAHEYWESERFPETSDPPQGEADRIADDHADLFSGAT